MGWVETTDRALYYVAAGSVLAGRGAEKEAGPTAAPSEDIYFWFAPASNSLAPARLIWIQNALRPLTLTGMDNMFRTQR